MKSFEIPGWATDTPTFNCNDQNEIQIKSQDAQIQKKNITNKKNVFILPAAMWKISKNRQKDRISFSLWDFFSSLCDLVSFNYTLYNAEILSFSRFFSAIYSGSRRINSSAQFLSSFDANLDKYSRFGWITQIVFLSYCTNLMNELHKNFINQLISCVRMKHYAPSLASKLLALCFCVDAFKAFKLHFFKYQASIERLQIVQTGAHRFCYLAL